MDNSPYSLSFDSISRPHAASDSARDLSMLVGAYGPFSILCSTAHHLPLLSEFFHLGAPEHVCCLVCR